MCCPIVRVLGYRSRGPGFDPLAARFSGKYWIWNADILSLVRITEELLERESTGSILQNRY
jgi:hypothetical protein